jgi:hypothetical protein
VEATGDEGCTVQERKSRVHGCRKGGGVTQAQSKVRLDSAGRGGLGRGLLLSSAGWLQRKGTLSLPVLVCSCCFKWVVCAPLAYEVSTTLRLLRAVNFAAKE